MPVAEFSDARLARLYDLWGTDRADLDFYVALAGETPLRVLDLCCGTGQITVALAERGHAMTGVDGAAAMLALARARPGGERVTWIEADVRDLVLDERFDFVLISGHAFQVFLSDDDVQAVLRTARGALTPGGRLAFETRNPLARAWEQWTPAAPARRLASAEEGDVLVTAHLRGVRDGYVDSELHYHFTRTGEELVSRQVLRFSTYSEVMNQPAAAGFRAEAVYGDWDRSPLTDRSAELIVVAR
ncbi:MAG TPA: class I SAM-dependent methyltransferase [Dehalococcoidia bacterium]|jgi:ubiquinone/menaquinone biosynthesis C-methylase UbiE